MAKIVIVMHDLRGGGAEKMMVRLANQLSANGDSVHLVLTAEGGVNKKFVNENVKLVELGCERTLSSFGKLRKTLKAIEPDSILSVLTHINVIAGITCFSLGWQNKLSVSERNAFSLDRSLKSDRVMKLVYFIAPFIYQLLPKPVIAVSKGVADDLVEHTIVKRKNVTTASNPVITDETIEAAKSAPQHEWLKHSDIPVLLSIGRLSHQKGFDLLLKAFTLVQSEIKCRLIIYGEGELREDLLEQAKHLSVSEAISFPGYIANPIAEMKAADLYILSSRFEGSPNAIVEAMSVNTAVIAFDCPHGPKEILKDGTVAPLVEYLNVDALAKEIVAVLKENKTVDYIQAVARFSSANSANEYRRLLLG
jgi:glycosyltransferase involved in cell wall biosynthesis